MSVGSDLVEMKRLEAAMDVDASALGALSTIASVFAFIATTAKAEGRDVAHDVELLARHAELSPSEARQVAASLQRLGFRAAAARLKQIAGRRRHDLRPLETGHTG